LSPLSTYIRFLEADNRDSQIGIYLALE
jgi:hypothetical protein